jgi:hypothetical protein
LHGINRPAQVDLFRQALQLGIDLIDVPYLMPSRRIEGEQLRAAVGPSTDAGPRLHRDTRRAVIPGDQKQIAHRVIDQQQLFRPVLPDLGRGNLGKRLMVQLTYTLLADAQLCGDVGLSPTVTAQGHNPGEALSLLRGATAAARHHKAS